MPRNVYRRSRSEDEPTLLASFELVGDQLEVKWHDDAFQLDIETWGLLTRDGDLRPKDGQPFFDELLQHFSNTHSTYVLDE